MTRYRLRLLLRGLWWRRGLTLAVLAVATVTTAAAALGPLYARAAAESTLQDELSGAPSSSSGLHYSATADVSGPDNINTVASLGPKAGSVVGYPNRIVGVYESTRVQGPAGAVISGVLARAGACQHIVILRGHCPTKAGEVLANQRTIDATYGWHVGARLTLQGLHVEGTRPDGTPVYRAPTAVIVGSYRPRDTADPFWFGKPYFSPQPATSGPDHVDTLIAARAEFEACATPQNAEVDVDLPLDARDVHLADVPRLRQQLSTAEQAALSQAGGGGADGLGAVNPLQSGVLSVLGRATHQRSLVSVGTTLVSLQLGLLAWLVLFQVMSEAAEARGNEVALAKVRGRRALSTLWFGLSEPLLLLLLAIPLGLGISVVAAHLFAATVLNAHIPVVVPLSAVVAALVAFAGGLVAAAITAQRTLTRSVLDQWRRATRAARPSRLALVVDLVVAAAAVATLVVLRTSGELSGENQPLSLVGPGLLVVAIGLVGTRVLPLVCRAASRPTRSSRRLGLFLAVRQVGRRPAGLRLAALLAIALGLATFAVAGEAVARANRQVRADGELGASKVVSIQYSPAVDPVAAVGRADPHGRWAMAAATWLPFGGDSLAGSLFAVDSRRLAAVGSSASGGPSPAQIARVIGTAGVPDVSFRATKVRVRLTATLRSAAPQPFLVVRLRSQHKPILNVTGPTLRAGTHDYAVDVPCGGSDCDLAGFYWERPVDAPDVQRGTVVFGGIDRASTGTGWSPLPVHATEPGAWRAAASLGEATDRVDVTASGVRDDFASKGGGFGGIDYSFPPSPMPAVATRRSLTTGSAVPKQRIVTDALQNVAPFTVHRYASVLPVVLNNGMLVDLRYVQALLPAFADEANWEILLGTHAPADALDRLRAAGLTVQRERTVAQRVDVLSREGPALALALLLGCAIAGAVLAVGATAISISASSRRRSYELAALRAVDVSRGALTRAGILEQMLLLGSAIVFGVPAGLLAARIALPTIPEFSEHTPIALAYGPPPLTITVFVAGFLVLLLATAIFSSVNLVRVAVPSRLREGVT